MDKYTGFAQESDGDLITSGTPTVRVTLANSDTLATIYSSDSLSATKANPFTLPTNGKIEFWARNGKYRVKLINGATETLLDEVVLNAGVTYNTLANRPAAGSADRIFIATDVGRASYDNGSAWKDYPDYTLDAMDWAAGADVASAATADVFGGTGNFIEITGTTGITALANGNATEGSPRLVRFAGALTLTYDATALELPNAENWTTAAGDYALVIGKGGSNVRVIPMPLSGVYRKATTAEARAGTSSVPVMTPANVRDTILLSSTTVSVAVAAVDLSLAYSDYRHFLIEFDGVRPSSDDQLFYQRVSEDAGASFKSGASDYAYVATGADFAGTGVGTGSSGAAQMQLQRLGADIAVAGSHISGSVKVFNPADTVRNKHFQGKLLYAHGAGAAWDLQDFAGVYKGTVNPINAVRFLFASGNIASGTFRLYGIP